MWKPLDSIDKAMVAGAAVAFFFVWWFQTDHWINAKMFWALHPAGCFCQERRVVLVKGYFYLLWVILTCNCLNTAGWQTK